MNPELDQDERDQREAIDRARVMLTATLVARDLSTEVRMRNLSETGALLEGGTLPNAGSRFQLQRGAHEIGGEVMWVKGRHCGVRFDMAIATADWIGASSAVAPKGFVKAQPAPLASPVAADTLHVMLPTRVGEELASVQRLIETMCNDLANNPLLVRRHLRAFQNADLAAQILGHLARVLTAEDRATAAEQIGMTELRERLLR